MAAARLPKILVLTFLRAACIVDGDIVAKRHIYPSEEEVSYLVCGPDPSDHLAH